MPQLDRLVANFLGNSKDIGVPNIAPKTRLPVSLIKNALKNNAQLLHGVEILFKRRFKRCFASSLWLKS